MAGERGGGGAEAADEGAASADLTDSNVTSLNAGMSSGLGEKICTDISFKSSFGHFLNEKKVCHESI